MLILVDVAVRVQRNVVSFTICSFAPLHAKRTMKRNPKQRPTHTRTITPKREWNWTRRWSKRRNGGKRCVIECHGIGHDERHVAKIRWLPWNRSMLFCSQNDRQTTQLHRKWQTIRWHGECCVCARAVENIDETRTFWTLRSFEIAECVCVSERVGSNQTVGIAVSICTALPM